MTEGVAIIDVWNVETFDRELRGDLDVHADVIRGVCVAASVTQRRPHSDPPQRLILSRVARACAGVPMSGASTSRQRVGRKRAPSVIMSVTRSSREFERKFRAVKVPGIVERHRERLPEQRTPTEATIAMAPLSEFLNRRARRRQIHYVSDNSLEEVALNDLPFGAARGALHLR